MSENNYNSFKAEPIGDGAYYKIGNHHYTELVCFAARVRSALASCGKFQSLSDNEVVAEIERLQRLDVESRSQQVLDVNEIKEKEFDSLLEEVTKLKNDLRIANKVIARLVGE